MKLLHIADLHIGKVVNGFPMIDDQKHALAGVLDAACRERVDALLMAGDLYDKSAPSAEAVSVLDWFLTSVADRGIPCFAIPGNHDSAERLAFGAALNVPLPSFRSRAYFRCLGSARSTIWR